MAGSLILVVGLMCFLFGSTGLGGRSHDDGNTNGKSNSSTTDDPEGGENGANTLFMYCAAGMRYPLEKIKSDYEAEFKKRGIKIQLQYGGSNTLLNQLEISKSGDLYLAADGSYIRRARDKGLVIESIPIAKMKPVIAVRRDSKKEISSIEDLLADGVKVALGDPGAAAIGKRTKKLLTPSGHWPELEKRTTANGVFKPTVNEAANAVKLGAVDATIIWDSTVAQYPEMKAISTPELDNGAVTLEVGVIANSKRAKDTLHFARYITARDRGQKVFGEMGWEVIDGDKWVDRPELTFFYGAVNRRALEPVVKKFEAREGVTINSVPDGCGILTARMKSINKDQSGGFPDVYMACDVYYLNTVKEMFQDDAKVSDTDIVIAVAKGNPKKIKKLEDLLRDDVRVVLGHPEQCTIGVLSKRVLEEKGIYNKLMKSKDVPMKPSSAMLITPIATQAADAVLAYHTDTKAEASKVDSVFIGSESSKAIQPFAVAKTSDHKYLSRRLFDTLAKSRDAFESAGFNWRLDQK